MQGAHCSCQKEKKTEKGIEIDLSQILIFYSNSSSEFIYAINDFSINLLVVYRESVNLIGYITRRLSAVSKIQLVVYHQYCILIG